jgi:hypothetical protein
VLFAIKRKDTIEWINVLLIPCEISAITKLGNNRSAQLRFVCLKQNYFEEKKDKILMTQHIPGARNEKF